MKVLMFGWEFPPHISGGLGTACFGLTEALKKEGIEVLFVVPKLFGDEPADSFLISASRVKAPGRGRRAVKALASRKTAMKSTRRRVAGELATIEVPSVLMPYQQAHTPSRYATTITSWNYSVEEGHLRHEAALAAGHQAPTPDGDAFEFSGTYGANLMEEVRRYASVAGILARNHTFDVIHVHDWMTFPAGVEAKRKSGKPLIVHVHSTEYDRSGSDVNPEVFEIERQGLEAADGIIAVSNWTKKIIVLRYNIRAEKITVVHNGVLPRARPADFVFPEIGSHFVTFLGRVTHQKGPGYFVEAAQKVLQEFPEAHFIVAGSGDLLPQIIERVAQCNMSANFHFTGFLSGSQVDQVWSLTDVYVMPSVSEPFGIAPLEAIQGGVPVILSNQSGVAEVMPHSIKVDFWDVKALAAAICSVLRYESLSTVLRHKSKQHLKHLTWTKAAREVKAVYHEIRERA